jgi:two-component system, sensor histidine kinase YesM
MRSLRTVILQRVWIVAAVSFLLSAGFTSYYYRTILVGQMVKDDDLKLQQTARQLQNITDDVAKFTFSLIISDQVQSFFKDYEKKDTFGKYALLEHTIEFLNDNKGLRKEVTSFAFVLPNGEVFWSEARTDGYFQEIMRQTWYTEYAASRHNYMFTKPHLMLPNGNPSVESEAISFIVKVRDIQAPGRFIGELIVNVDYSAFETALNFGSLGFDGFLLVDEMDNVLYKSSANLPPHLDIRSAGKSRDGYVAIERIAGSNWRLVSFTSWSSLMERSKIIIYLLGFFSLISTSLILLLMMPAIFRITKPIMQLYQATNAVSNGNLQASVSIQTGDELERLGQGFNRMIDRLRQHLEESILYEKEKRDMELNLLLSQLNPHFMYNTLNAVIYMAQREGNSDIVKMVGSFIRLLQDAAKLGSAHTLIPLKEEIDMLRDYAVIQSYRYKDMLIFRWNIDPAAEDCLVPRYLIQPFVENAIFHGIAPKDEKGTITISAFLNGSGRLFVAIEDDGIGMETDKLAQIMLPQEYEGRSTGLRHIGLSNTRKRLEQLFGKQSSLLIESFPNLGTKISIELPASAAEA